MKVNSSGLKPKGHAVLIRPYEPERKDSMIALPESVQRSTAIVNTRAVVVEAGPLAWDGERRKFLGIPLWKLPRAKPGNKVFITAYAGFLATGTKDNEQYRLVNDADIFCEITGEDNG